jgi:hypothetical protein
MQRENEGQQLQQTGLLLGAANLLLWPFYWADRRLGVTASVITTLAAVGILHQIGKEEQASVSTNRNTWFHHKPEDPIKDAFDNVLTGAEKVSGLLTGKGPSAS